MSTSEKKISNIKDLGEAFLRYRELNKMSQETMAGLMGVSRKVLSEIENGKKETFQIGKILQMLHRLGFEIRIVPKERR